MFTDIHHFSQLSSCIGSNSCGVGAPITFGAVSVTATNVSESWLADSTTTEDFDMTGSNQGMYNSYASISAGWSDTTNMDNLRAADITDSTIAGSVETFGGKWGDGHSFHTASDSVYGA